MRRNVHARGYVLMVVVVAGIVLASLAGILLYATTRDRAENRQQTTSMRAVYAAEAAVSVGVQNLLLELNNNTVPDLTKVESLTAANAASAVPGASFPTLSVRYYDSATNTVSATPPAATALQVITSGPNAGLSAQQTPIQVFALAQVDKATASIADAIRVDLIPVFQFGVFFDGDLETYIPATMVLNGRVHANGDIYLSNSTSSVTFQQRLTSAKRIWSRSAFSSSVAVGANLTLARDGSGTLVGMPTDLPKSTDALQMTAIQNKFGVTGNVGDRSTGIQALSIPIRLSSASTCTTSCTAGLSCVRIRATDTTGVCMPNVVSRPDKCSNGTTKAAFPQSLAVELIKRPKPAYANTGVNAPYVTGSTALTDVYSVDFGPRPAIVENEAPSGQRDANDIFEIEMPRSVPIVRVNQSDDDPGTIVDRMYWKAHIRIIDGVWYRRDSNEPIFDPELVNYTSTLPRSDDLNHKFARVVRYSWWWDARESRVYCENAGDKNCVTDGNDYHRGLQIRSADFDGAAFMDLLTTAGAPARLFADGTIPSGGVIVYMSETYDARLEDRNTLVDRAKNVRNFLNIPIVHNHMDQSAIDAPTGSTPVRVAPVKTANGPTPVNPPTPHRLGWYPENIWGRLAPTGHRSLTPPVDNTGATVTGGFATAYATPKTTTSSTSGFECQRSANLSAARMPSSRPTAFTTPTIIPPCIQAGATPLGAENAVRIVRGQTLPAQGFTFVTDNRLYLHGDINVANNSANSTTKQDIPGKMAIIADSITILSDKFDDRSRQDQDFEAFYLGPNAMTPRTWTTSATILPWSVGSNAGNAPNLCSLGATTPVDTRVNASLLMGDVPSCIDAGDANGNRSGGINNFPRFAESWSNVNSIINGSIVGLFRSERGNARFTYVGFGTGSGSSFPGRGASPYGSDQGCYYTAPNRTWSFDPALLTNINNLPPGTPRVVGTQRLRWVRR